MKTLVIMLRRFIQCQVRVESANKGPNFHWKPLIHMKVSPIN